MKGLLRTLLLCAVSSGVAACNGGTPANQQTPAEQGSSTPSVSGPSMPAPPPAAPAGPTLAESNSQNGDFKLAVTEAARSNGVLTIKATFTLLDGQTGSRRLLFPSDAGELYLVAGDQKYMILKDNEGDPLTTAGGYYPSFRRLGDTNNWWGKFPAPPPEVKSISLYFKDFLPVENIPITDR